MLKQENKINNILNEVSKVIVGKDELLKRVLAGILADGHILFHDVPGLKLRKIYLYGLLNQIKMILFLKLTPK